MADPGPDSPKQVIPAREAISNALRKASKFDEEVRYGVAVDDVGRTLAELERENVTVLKPLTEGVTVKRFTLVADPSGFPVELYERRG